MNWRDKTCEKCVFRVGDECRRFPPTTLFTHTLRGSSFPMVAGENRFGDACAEYSEDGKPSEVVRNAVLAIMNEPVGIQLAFPPYNTTE